MSHTATHWLATVPPEDMTHGEFRVLFHLCDCHNPSMGCFPMQAYLREHTGLSNGGLNKALGELERKGLVRRERDRDARTNRQKPTRYILGFEMEDAQEPSPLSGGGAVSTFGAEPSPLLGGSVSTGVESYTKDKPVIEPVKEPCATAQTSDLSDDFVDRFFAVYPRAGDREKTEAALKKAVCQDGVSCDAILSGATAYAAEQKGNHPRYIAYSENWVEQKRWLQFVANRDPQSAVELMADDAAVIKGTAKDLSRRNKITPAMAKHLVTKGLVTSAECRNAGIKV